MAASLVGYLVVVMAALKAEQLVEMRVGMRVE
jgi:hypothetical protein